MEKKSICPKLESWNVSGNYNKTNSGNISKIFLTLAVSIFYCNNYNYWDELK